MRLASAIDDLRHRRLLIEVDRSVDPVYELAAHVAGAEGRPILFRRVGNARFPIFYNLYGHAGWVAEKFRTSRSGIVRSLLQAYDRPVPPQAVVSTHEVVCDGPIDLAAWLPIGRDYARQSVPYLNAGVIFVRDPDSGLLNASMHSLNLVAPDRLVVHVQAEHFPQIYAKWHRSGKPMPIAVAVGVDPAVWLACALAVEHPPAELDIAGGLAAGAVPVMKCATLDLEVPAETEILLEGYALPNQRAEGGPETLPSRMYGGAYHGPLAQIHRVSAYSDAVAHGLLNASIDHLNVMHWLKEFQILLYLRQTAFGAWVRAVKVSPGGSDWMCAAIAIEREHAGRARELIDLLLSAKLALGGLRRVIVVDTDIDVGDPCAIDWALATRVRPDMDLVIKEASRLRGPDPMARGGPVAKLGIDATVPLGRESDHELPTIPWSAPLDLPHGRPPVPPAGQQIAKPAE